MRKIFLIVIASGVLLSFFRMKGTKKQQMPNFQGTWNWIDNESSKRYNFVLTIVDQKNNQIKGYHDIVAQGGNKIDTAGFEDEGGYSISGKVENSVATVYFKSGYDLNAGGTATLKFIASDKIEWKVIKRVKGGLPSK